MYKKLIKLKFSFINANRVGDYIKRAEEWSYAVQIKRAKICSLAHISTLETVFAVNKVINSVRFLEKNDNKKNGNALE